MRVLSSKSAEIRDTGLLKSVGFILKGLRSFKRREGSNQICVLRRWLQLPGGEWTHEDGKTRGLFQGPQRPRPGPGVGPSAESSSGLSQASAPTLGRRCGCRPVPPACPFPCLQTGHMGSDGFLGLSLSVALAVAVHLALLRGSLLGASLNQCGTGGGGQLPQLPCPSGAQFRSVFSRGC